MGSFRVGLCLFTGVSRKRGIKEGPWGGGPILVRGKWAQLARDGHGLHKRDTARGSGGSLEAQGISHTTAEVERGREGRSLYPRVIDPQAQPQAAPAKLQATSPQIPRRQPPGAVAGIPGQLHRHIVTWGTGRAHPRERPGSHKAAGPQHPREHGEPFRPHQAPAVQAWPEVSPCFGVT